MSGQGKFTLLFLTSIFVSVCCNLVLASNSYASLHKLSPSEEKLQDKTLVVANSKAWKPFSYVDASGEAQGLLVDIWKEYGRVNQVQISFLLTDWNESLESVKKGRADVHAGMLWSETREAHFDYLEGIVKIDTQLFFSSTILGTEPVEYLTHGHVGVVIGGYEESYIKEHFPNATLFGFANNELMLKHALNGNLDAFVADFQVANFYLHTSDKANQFLPVKHLYSGYIRPAIAEGDYELRLALKKGFDLIPAVDLERIERKWIHVETVYPEYFLPAIILLTFTLVISYILHLRSAVASRTKALQLLNEKLQRLASEDSMTGIYNRRYFIEQLKLSCKKNHGNLSLLLFDIDRFKAINDNFGHHVGDFIICELVKTVQHIVPKESLFARIGGEEFCILIEGLSYEETQDFAKKVQQSVSTSLYPHDDFTHIISVSLGAVHVNQADVDHQYLINQADRLMYVAKTNGRDCYQTKSLESAER